MEVDTFQTLLTQGGTTAGDKAEGTGFAQNFETFLTLLTTQLKNQDPLSPTDATEFTNQLVRFAAVEQAIKTNAKLEDLLAIEKANQTSAAVGYLGKEIEAEGEAFPLANGEGRFKYALAKSADTTTIVISDSDGKVVNVIEGETGAGPHEFVWDGTDSSGIQLPDGVYTVSVTAVDADDELIDVSTAIIGLVDGVGSTEEGLLLSVGNVPVRIDDIIAVREPATGAGA